MLLPDASEKPKLPPFLPAKMWVDFRGKELHDDDALWRLECGILGKAPGRGRPQPTEQKQPEQPEEHQPLPTLDPTPLRNAYLQWLLDQSSQLSLAGIDKKAAGKGAEDHLNLSAIYTALLTLEAEHERDQKPGFLEKPGFSPDGDARRRLSAVAQLNRHARLVLLGDPGSDKSTFVNFVVLCLAGELLFSLQEGKPTPGPSQEGNWAEDAWGALLAGQLVAENANLQKISPRNQAKIERLRAWLVAIATERVPFDSAQGTGMAAPFPALERALAGTILAQLGDRRPGVGCRSLSGVEGSVRLPDIVWCEVPAGAFMMGSDESSWERPPHRVTLSRSYALSRYPVTNAQYQTFVADGGYTEKWQTCWSKEGWQWKEENAKTGPGKSGGEFDLPNHPVVVISWHEAATFCQWLTRRLQEIGELTTDQEIRLPTEAEWEKAARGADGQTYPWGNEAITPEHANYDDTGLGVTSAVGCFPRGVSPCGCDDMSGNVWEWCLDSCDFDKNYNLVTDTYTDGIIDPLCTTGSVRVLRGGSWAYDARSCRTASRLRDDPGDRDGDVGFRLLRTPS